MNKKFKMMANLALLSQVGISMIVPIFGGVFLGHWLDEKVGTKFIFLLIGVVMGISVAFSTLFKMTSKGLNSRKNDKDKRK